MFLKHLRNESDSTENISFFLPHPHPPPQLSFFGLEPVPEPNFWNGFGLHFHNKCYPSYLRYLKVIFGFVFWFCFAIFMTLCLQNWTEKCCLGFFRQTEPYNLSKVEGGFVSWSWSRTK